jgi:hypothetical protein
MENNTPIANASLPAITDALPEGTSAEVTTQDIGSPEDYAAMFFRLNLVKLKTNLFKLSQNQLRRVILTAATYPLNEYDHTTKAQEEKSVLHILNEMMNQKAIMQLHVEMEKTQVAMDKQREEQLTAVEQAPALETGEKNG